MRGDVVEKCFNAFGVRVRNLRERAVVGAVGALQTFGVVVLQILADQRLGLFLVGLDEMQRFGEGADDFGDERAALLDGFSRVTTAFT